MIAFEFFRYFLILIVPGLIGALAYSITYRLRTEINIYVALILDFLTFLIMLTGLYFCKDVFTVSDLLIEFTCLHFTIIYGLISMWVAIILGVIFGFIRRLFFWIRR
jgi:hypothetical protein